MKGDDTMNLAKLKGKVREKGKNYEQCAKAIGRSVVTFNAKINGSVKFYIDELTTLGDFLDMTPEERADIFLH